MENVKKNFIFIKLIFLVIFAYSAIVFVHSYSRSTTQSVPSFTVEGQGKVVAVPDIARFTLGVLTEGGVNLAELQKENTQKINAVIDFLKDKDIDKEDIKTESYNISPRRQFSPCPRLSGAPCLPPEIVGYSISQTLSVKIRDFDSIGDVLSNIVSKGANNVSQLSFTFDDPAELENDARTKAIKEARDKAKSIAKAGGFRLGKLLSVNDRITSPIIPFARTFEATGVGGDLAPSIEPGSQDVIINITLRYEIK